MSGWTPDRGETEAEAAPLALINTTPLVDVMLVLLIIFLITVPVVTASIPVRLPRQSAVPAASDPKTVTVTVTQSGALFWNDTPLADASVLAARLSEAAEQSPQPLVRLRGDGDAAYAEVARVVTACRAAGLTRLGFLTDPQSPDTATER
jgi:biopolymer transport protein ExbD